MSYQTLIPDLSEIPVIDSSASLAVEEVIERALAGKRSVLLVGVKPRVEQVLAKLVAINLVDLNARFGDRIPALRHAAT